MKNFTKILLALICLAAIYNPLFSQAPTNGLVAYYPFTGNPNDASGNGQNGITSGGISLTTDRYGNSGQAYLFNGSNAGIAVNSWNTITGNAPRTMSIWFKTSNGSVSQQMLSWGTNSASSSCYMGLGIYSGTKFLGFFGFSNDLALVDAFQFYDNRWHNMTFTFDGSTMTLFFDGVVVISRTGATLNTGSSRLTIGFHYTNVDYFNGSLDDIRVYNRALSVSEVQQTYLAEVATSPTTDVIKLGSDKFIHATGPENTFVGLRAGAFANGSRGTFMGRNTGMYNIGIDNSFFGLNSGRLNSAGFNNAFFGKGTGEFNITGNENTYVGMDAGWQSVGSNNVAVGRGSGGWATTGNNNTMVGWLAGLGNQNAPNVGSLNTFVGSVAGAFNTSGSYNSFLGASSGYKNTTGSNNTYLGHNTGFENTIGESNTFIGFYSGFKNVDGNNNTFVGKSAGEKNISGPNNVYIGWASGYENTTGGDNTALGTQAGGLTSTGAFNTSFGKLAGYFNSTGSFNTYLGAGADGFGPNKGILTNATAIGANAKVSSSNSIVLGDTANLSLNVGIGTSRPNKRLEVRAANSNESGIRTTNLTASSPTTSGNGKVLTVNALGDFILVPDGGSGSNTHSDSIWVRNGFNTNFGGGNVGIGTTIPQSKLDINGDINISNNMSYRIGNEVFIKGLESSRNNTLIGFSAGLLLTSTNGIGNTLIGKNSGAHLVSGQRNTFIGDGSGFKSIGNNLVAIGRSAGAFATAGSNNTFVGEESGEGADSNPLTGSDNTFLGYLSGNKATSGSSNTFIGTGTGANATTGQRNVFVGLNSGRGTSIAFNEGASNTFIGTNSGEINTTGMENTSLGYRAGDGNTTGSYNLYLGANADGFGVDANNLQRSVAIGYNSKVSINDAIVLGDSDNPNIKVGIGLHNPKYRLDVKGVFNVVTAFNNPSMKVNGKDFMGIDEVGEFWVSNFKMKFKNKDEWADKVFEENYQLMPLTQLEDFILKNKHLPNLPSATEVVEKGVSNKDITAKLLEKIEELTLYQIEQNKRMLDYFQIIEALKSELNLFKSNQK